MYYIDNMNCLKLLYQNIIDPVTEVHINFIKSSKYAIRTPHCHNFHELFLVITGRVSHWVNGERQLLNEGALVFIRPNDIHYYEQYNDEDCQLVNLAFLSYIIPYLFSFLGDCFHPQRLLDSKVPYQTVLTPIEVENLLSRLEILSLMPNMDKTEVKIRFRALLAEVFSTYFPLKLAGYNKEYTDWIELVYQEMQKKENFVAGISSMLHLSGKSQEHLCRTFKSRYNMTPTQFINSLRLNYAANLLEYTDKNITEISQESGFENLSHFYHLFRKCFRQSPADYRSTNKKIVIP